MSEYERLRDLIDGRAATGTPLNEIEREIIDRATQLSEESRSALWLYAEAVCEHADRNLPDHQPPKPSLAIHD